MKQRFSELRAHDFPDAGASEALTLLADLLSALQDKIASISDERTLVMITELIWELGKTLEYFDNAGTDQTPRGLVCLLRSLYARLGRSSKLLAWPQASYNFTIRSFVQAVEILFKGLRPDARIDALLSGYAGPREFVSFPRTERDNALMHAVFGHEVGHPIGNDYLKKESATPEFKRKEAQVRNEVKSVLTPTASVTELHAALQNVFILRTRALQELISDVVGIYLFGLSALFAGHDILLRGLDMLPAAWNEFYPPGRMRIRESILVARAEGHHDILVKQSATSADFAATELLFNRLEEIAAKDDDRKTVAADAFANIAYEWVETSLPDAKAYARAAVSAELYTSTLFDQQVPLLVARLKEGLPPNELGNPLTPTSVDERSAILAAWVAVLGETQNLTDLKAANVKVSKLNEKTLRAIEYIILQRQYSAWCASP